MIATFKLSHVDSSPIGDLAATAVSLSLQVTKAPELSVTLPGSGGAPVFV